MKTSTFVSRLALVSGLTAFASSLGCTHQFDCCSYPPDQGEDQEEEVRSPVERNTSPAVAPTDTATLVAGNTAFAVDLYKTLRENQMFAGSNLVFSPQSVSATLAMTYAGARGATKGEIASALHFTLPEDKLHPAFNALDLALSGRGDKGQGSGRQPFVLRMANSLWASVSVEYSKHLESTFLDTIAEHYASGLHVLAPSPALFGWFAQKRINAWVSKATDGKIRELVAPGPLDGPDPNPNGNFLFVNAAYFSAPWASPFKPAWTKEGTFHAANGDELASFMAQTSSMKHARGTNYDAVSLPYDGGELDFVAIVPDAGAFDAFEAALDGEQLRTIASSLEDKDVALKLPKFRCDARRSISLKDSLQALGMNAAFSERADFSGISTTERLSILDALHQAVVAVDEEGTDAATGTAVTEISDPAPSSTPPVSVVLDRPFVFAIRDRATGAFVFLGRVLSPSL